MKTVKIQTELTEHELATLLDAINCYENQVTEALIKENRKAEADGKIYILGKYFGQTLTHDLRLKLKLGKADLDKALMRNELKTVEDIEKVIEGSK